MRNPLATVKTWGRQTFQVLRAFEEAVEYRYEDYAQDRFARLEQRVAALEQGRGAPDSSVSHHGRPEADSDPR